MTACVVCGDPRTLAKNRCGTCYQYRRRTGVDRSFKLVKRLTERDIERELIRENARNRRPTRW